MLSKGDYDCTHIRCQTKEDGRDAHGCLTCEVCQKQFKPECVAWGTYDGANYYAKVNLHCHSFICDHCYDKLPKSDICKVCDRYFPSRNQLFNHLHDEDHFL